MVTSHNLRNHLSFWEMLQYAHVEISMHMYNEFFNAERSVHKIDFFGTMLNFNPDHGTSWWQFAHFWFGFSVPFVCDFGVSTIFIVQICSYFPSWLAINHMFYCTEWFESRRHLLGFSNSSVQKIIWTCVYLYISLVHNLWMVHIKPVNGAKCRTVQ